MTTKLQLTAIITATIMFAGIIGVGFSEQAFASKPTKLDCWSEHGSFNGVAQNFEGSGNCTKMGKTEISGTYSIDGIVIVEGVDCITVTSTDTEITRKNGASVTLSTESTQCFFENGSPISVGDITSWCDVTSTVDGEFTIVSGTGSFEGAVGSGIIHSDAEHCGDTIVTFIRGTVA